MSSSPIKGSPRLNYAKLRAEMVRQIMSGGIKNQRVLDAMGIVPREKFVRDKFWKRAVYGDRATPIGHGQTMSQPWMVAKMVESVELKGNEKVLEIGVGTGYGSAILGQNAAKVFSTEIILDLARQARNNHLKLGYKNITVIDMDGTTLGYPQEAPYDAILLTACMHPKLLVAIADQLVEGGRFAVPVVTKDIHNEREFIDNQMLIMGLKKDGRMVQTSTSKCGFVPLIGDWGWSITNPG
jgi:protein-L-isoaspartate(D-aspartate) O-methyltransferase